MPFTVDESDGTQHYSGSFSLINVGSNVGSGLSLPA
jgi:hypothetical protein